jgi:hypothetical protein
VASWGLALAPWRGGDASEPVDEALLDLRDVDVFGGDG